jgi:Raf kinase inhibitor-like YbhB/YbcL family protein
MRTRVIRLLLIQVLALGLASGGAFAQGRRGGRGGGLSMITVTSSAFADGAEIPAKYTGAQGVSPELSWSGAPAGTMSYVLIMHDLDVAIPAGNLTNDITHWVVWNIPASVTTLPEGGPVPADAHQISMRGPQYMGPAPPAGHPYHHYVFEIYALNSTLDLPATASRADVEKAMDGKIVARGAYVGRAKPAQ